MQNLISLSIVAVLLCGCTKHIQEPGDYIQYYQAETHKPYSDVIEELKIAISEQNFRITSHSRVGKVIRDRGTPEFPDYDTIQFCNLTHAKTLLELSVDAIRHMPCSIVVYSRSDRTVIKARLLPTDSDHYRLNQFSESINGILKEMVNFAAEE